MNKAEARLKAIEHLFGKNHRGEITISSSELFGLQHERAGILLGIEATKEEYEEIFDAKKQIVDSFKASLLEELKLQRVCVACAQIHIRNGCEIVTPCELAVKWSDIEAAFR